MKPGPVADDHNDYDDENIQIFKREILKIGDLYFMKI